MEVESVYLHKDRDGKGLKARAEINVPGIGVIKIEHAMSDELCEKIRIEVIASLRTKLGQRVQSENMHD